jgi:hypothetical protein
MRSPHQEWYSTKESNMPAVSHVNTWRPANGKALEMLEAMGKAKAIHERLGATVYVSQCTAGDQAGTIAYMTVFPSGTAFGQFVDALAADVEWLTFWSETSANGSGDFVTGSLFQGLMGFDA